MPEVEIIVKRVVKYSRTMTVTDEEAATIRARANRGEWHGLADDLVNDSDYIDDETFNDADIMIDGKMVYGRD